VRVLHFYTMKQEPDRVRAVAAAHAAYWHNLEVPGYVGGPFADRSGGLITFEVDSEEDAERLIAGDPFVREQLLESSSVQQWAVE
jgi:uncharacterized protein YciI